MCGKHPQRLCPSPGAVHQDLAPSPEGKNVSMGAFVRDVFLEQVAPCWQACIRPCPLALCRLCPEHSLTRLDCFAAATSGRRCGDADVLSDARAASCS